MQERVGYEHQTPMFPNGFGVTHAILVQPQMLFTILIKSLYRPTQQVSGDDPLRGPIYSVGHQHNIGAGQVFLFEADDDSNLAQCGNAHSSGESPIVLVLDCRFAISIGRNEGYKLVHGDVRPFQGDWFPLGVLQDETVRFQVAVLFQQTNPVLVVAFSGLDQGGGQKPTIEQERALY